MIQPDFLLECHLDQWFEWEPGTPKPDVQPASVDLHLGRGMKIMDTREYITIDGKHPPKWKNLRPWSVLCNDPINAPSVKLERYMLQPGAFVLATTSQRINVPLDHVARVEGCSTVGRCGLAIHITAGFIDPGFCGTITLELKNVAGVPIMLTEHDRICQVTFEKMESASRGYQGRYQNQRGTTVPTLKVSR